RLAVGLATGSSRDLLERGDVSRGMVFMAHGLEAAAEDKDLRRPILANLSSWHHRMSRLTALLEHPGQVHAVAFSRDGETILTGCGDFRGQWKSGEARLWEAATGERIGLPLKHETAVSAVAFSPDDRKILTGGLDGKVRLWEAGRGKLLPFR